MKISIITVCFNASKTIEQAVKSVLDQNYPNLEYIIVDGASTDGTKEILAKYPAINKIISEPDKGIYDAMNKGIKAATGEVVGILNADDFYIDNNVLFDIAALFRDKEVEAGYANLEYVQSENVQKVVRRWKSGEYRPGMFNWGWMPPHPTFFARRELFQKLGNYVSSFSIAADYELMLRFMHLHKLNVSYLPRTIVRMRTGGKSGSSIENRLLSSKEDVLAWKINHLKPPKFLALKKKIRKLSQFLPW